MALARLIEQFEKEMELTPGQLQTETLGVFSIPLEEKLFVTLKEEPGNPNFHLFSAIADCPKGKEEAMYSHLLDGNLLGQGTRGAALGLSEDGGTITLSLIESADIDYREFHDVIEDFINTVDFWREELEI